MDIKSWSFKSLGLSPALLEALKKLNHKQPTPIQRKAIPTILQKKDVLGIAKTGSGKTAGYLLPLLQHWMDEKWEMESRHIPALILVPTRELASQVHNVLQDLTSEFIRRPKSMAVYGGVSINPQMIGMQGVDILIATPGRLLDLIDSKALRLSDLKILVLDEADKMLNLGFKDEMDRLLALMPEKRQNLLFSATLSKEVDLITQMILTEPATIKIASETTDIELIDQRSFRVTKERKGPFLRYLIKKEDMEQVLVFTSSVYSANHVAEKLRKNGIDAEATHSKKSNKARLDALNDFKIGALRVLVATDLLSRGIDIEFLPYVINYELPRSPKDFIHRIGRTGRAENPGKAYTIVTPEEQHHFKVIQKKMKKWLTLEGTEAIDLKGQ